MTKHADSQVTNPIDAELDQLVVKTLECFHVAGLSLAVIHGDDIWERGYGFADLEHKKDVTPSTLFANGSTTKTYTAAAVSVLIDDAVEGPHGAPITWTTPMQQLISEDFVLQSESATKTVTVEDCLSHRSGMPTHQGCLGNFSVKDSTCNLRHLTISKAPGTVWQYSNHMYWAVSHMIEVLSGQDLETFMKERLWKPLEMDNTFLSLHQSRRYVDGNEEACLAKPYGWNAETQSYLELPYWDDKGISGSGALVSNVHDQAKWIQSFIHQSGPLSKASYAAVKTPRMECSSTSPRFSTPDYYGLGWHVSRYHGYEVLHHPGGIIAFSANMIYLPEKKWGVVGMCNSSTDSALEAAMWHLVDKFLEIPLEDRIDVFAQAESSEVGRKAYVDGARERFFPSIPSPPTPLSLPTAEYAGAYTHLAYGTLTISLFEGDLRGRFPGRKALDLDPIVLQHVSGDSFFAKAEVPTVMSLRMKMSFEVDATCSATRLGLEFAKDDVIWFVRG